MKICKECQHFDGETSCTRKVRVVRVNPVYGYSEREGYKDAAHERGPDLPWPIFVIWVLLAPHRFLTRCGKRAKFFKPKVGA